MAALLSVQAHDACGDVGFSTRYPALLGPRETSDGASEHREYRVYVESILRPLRPESMRAFAAHDNLHDDRRSLEAGLMSFERQLRDFVTGCDERKFSKAALRRARGIECQLTAACESLLANLLRDGVSSDDLHGIWHGFALVRNWRDSRVPQECFLAMLRGMLERLDEDESTRWTTQAMLRVRPSQMEGVWLG